MTGYPVQTVTLQIGRWKVVATEPATAEGKRALVAQAIPQIARLLRKDEQKTREASNAIR